MNKLLDNRQKQKVKSSVRPVIRVRKKSGDKKQVVVPAATLHRHARAMVEQE